MRPIFPLAAGLIAACSSVQAQPSAVPSAAELSGILRSLILPSLPNPLVEKEFNWGRQEQRPNGINWERKGILLKPEITKKLKNDGIWRKIAVTADNPEKTLQVAVKDVSVPEPGKLTFSIELVLPARIKFEQQFWRSGLRLYAGETRARCKTVLYLRCESTSRIERKPDSFLPDVVFRLRVLEAKLNYFDFVVEHTLGIGGDGAKFLGDAVHDTIKQWRPSLERDLLEKANKAIVKAGDTKEVRLSLSRLLDGKK